MSFYFGLSALVFTLHYSLTCLLLTIALCTMSKALYYWSSHRQLPVYRSILDTPIFPFYCKKYLLCEYFLWQCFFFFLIGDVHLHPTSWNLAGLWHTITFNYDITLPQCTPSVPISTVYTFLKFTLTAHSSIIHLNSHTDRKTRYVVLGKLNCQSCQAFYLKDTAWWFVAFKMLCL